MLGILELPRRYIQGANALERHLAPALLLYFYFSYEFLVGAVAPSLRLLILMCVLL